MKQVLKNILNTLIIMGVFIAAITVFFYIGASLPIVITSIATSSILFIGIYHVVNTCNEKKKKKNACKTIWLAVEKNGSEWAFTKKPTRMDAFWCGNREGSFLMSEGIIEAATGRKLGWGDEPLEIIINEKK